MGSLDPKNVVSGLLYPRGWFRLCGPCEVGCWEGLLPWTEHGAPLSGMGRVGGGPRPPRASRGPGSWVPARGRGRLRAESPRLSPPAASLEAPHPARSALEFGSGGRSAESSTDSLLPLRMHGLGALGVHHVPSPGPLYWRRVCVSVKSTLRLGCG